MPFRIALSGLDAASTDLQVTGHNIANSATAGFKQSRAEFADIYATSIQDVSSTSSGRGVKVTRVAQQFSQGSLNFTSNNLDLAISGEGFFILKDTAGNTSYSRAGAFSSDRNGNVVNHANENLQVFAPIDTAGTRFNTGATVDLVLPTLSGAPQATDNVIAALNLDAAETQPGTAWPAGTTDTTDVAYSAAADPTFESNITTDMYNHATSTTIYDSLGNSHRATMYYRKTATSGLWQTYTYIDGTLAGDGATANHYSTLQFQPSGALDTTAGSVDAQGRFDLDAWTPVNGADPITVTFDYAATSQYGADFAVNDLTQDGFTAGRLSGVDVDNSGVIFARFTNGQSTALGKVALAKFNNPQGLRQLGDTSWAQTYTAGDVQMGEPGTSSLGLIQSGALENSNVDIAEQLVNLITAQRNFQANAQVITTADTITQTIINIR
ncbi:MAG: flagellar hook protein FlgE [Chromatiaceae bacterium]|nr:flagellar hook protein FlgE [Gammaproteobacteria bacterium]MCB1871041.1 flagellar hook protein FlgE [Gammaproteobacteria bacterium]MCB1879958.1 flagellar hook protein FlgE [Gammaproteobacteria bacterium]MCP5427283.1 flagellar hook protein FlgE [Chromatiaceae bacterium]MCP5447880.1 flagellar hook protein FlgE [Chromatiaceae bacterium]